jgi:hypothetical protein
MAAWFPLRGSSVGSWAQKRKASAFANSSHGARKATSSIGNGPDPSWEMKPIQAQVAGPKEEPIEYETERPRPLGDAEFLRLQIRRMPAYAFWRLPDPAAGPFHLCFDVICSRSAAFLPADNRTHCSRFRLSHAQGSSL